MENSVPLTDQFSRYFLFAYLTTTTIPAFAQIEERLGICYAQTSWTISLPSLGLAIGPPLWSSIADIYGRRIVFIIGSVIALVSTIGTAVTTNFSGYMAGRFFQGVGVSPSAAIGMAIGKQMCYHKSLTVSHYSQLEIYFSSTNVATSLVCGCWQWTVGSYSVP